MKLSMQWKKEFRAAQYMYIKWKWSYRGRPAPTSPALRAVGRGVLDLTLSRLTAYKSRNNVLSHIFLRHCLWNLGCRQFSGFSVDIFSWYICHFWYYCYPLSDFCTCFIFIILSVLAPLDNSYLVTVAEKIGYRAEIFSANWQLSTDTPVAIFHMLSKEIIIARFTVFFSLSLSLSLSFFFSFSLRLLTSLRHITHKHKLTSDLFLKTKTFTPRQFHLSNFFISPRAWYVTEHLSNFSLSNWRGVD